MCKAFSLLITKSNKAYWKAGVDSHDELQSLFVKKDKELIDDRDAPDNTFARIEISPQNEDYLRPDKWVYTVDERVKPEWLTKEHEKNARAEWRKWKEEIYSNFNVKEALKPIHPFKIKPPKEITEKHIRLVNEFASVEDFVGASVWDSVRASVRDFVRDSVGASVRDSVRDSVGASVWAYYGSLFPKITDWKYIDRRKEPFNKIKGYPFQSTVTLWKMGLVASFNGEYWRLHGGKDAKVLWTGKV